MIQDVIVIDDCISEHNQSKIEQIVFGGDLPFYYRHYSNYNTFDGHHEFEKQFITQNPNIKDTPQFVHNVCEGDKQHSNVFYHLLPLLSAIPFSLDFVSIKINLKQPTVNYTEHNIGMPHVDYINIPNIYSALYYVNDSDGETVIYNEQFRGLNTKQNLSIKTKILPKKGRLVIFNGQNFHSANTPIHSKARAVVNINFTTYENSACL